MKIRRASYKDIDPLLNLMHELGCPSKKDVITESLAEYKRSEGYEVFVAEYEGKVIGCISLHVMKLFHPEGRAGRITSIVVSRENRGEGVGKTLVNAAEQYFERMGCVKAEVTSSDHRIRLIFFISLKALSQMKGALSKSTKGNKPVEQAACR